MGSAYANVPMDRGLLQSLFTRTTIKTTATTTTLTVAQFQSCIGSAQFTSDAAGTTLTAPCAALRRRRAAAEIVDQLVEVTPVLP